MTRIQILSREEMDDEQGAVFDAAKEAGRPLGGPYYAYIRTPKFMQIAQDLTACLAESTLTSREQQIAILTIARHWGAKYPWAVQVRGSLKIGLEQEVIDAINARTPPPLTDSREKLAHRLAKELLAEKGLSGETYAAAENVFSIEELVMLVARVGLFSMTCCTANAFDVTPPDEAPARLMD